MTPTMLALVLLAAGTYAMKAVGPLFAGGRELSPTAARLTDLLPAALLAALVANQTFSGGEHGLLVDARIVGIAAAALAVWLRAPFAVVVVVGAAVTALVRALGWG